MKSATSKSHEQALCRQKAVSFGNEEDMAECFAVAALSSMTKEEVSCRWYSRQDLLRIRKENIMISREIRFRHELDNENPKNYTNSQLRVFQQCHQDCNQGPSHEAMVQLVHWIKSCPGRRGLERSKSMINLQELRKQCERKYIQETIQCYQENFDIILEPDLLAEKVRCKADNMSRGTRMFAMCMGIADQVAAREEGRWDELTTRKSKSSSADFHDNDSEDSPTLEQGNERSNIIAARNA